MIKKRYIVLGIVFFLAIILLFSSVYTVKSGNVGIISTNGAVSTEPVEAGLHFKVPFVQKVVMMNVKTLKAEASCAASSKDLQLITTSIAVNYHVNQESAPTLYRTVGKDYETVIIVPAIQESVKAVIAKYSAEQTTTQRQIVSTEISELLAKKISSYGITVEQFNILNLDFSDSFNAAIEAKQTAQQEALKAEQDLARIEIEAQQTVTKAQAQADAQRAKAEAEAYTIQIVQEQLAKSQDYIRYLQTQRWDGVLPQVQGGDTNPIIDLRP